MREHSKNSRKAWHVQWMRKEFGEFKAEDKADVEKAARAAGEINATQEKLAL